jgi:hypothetical protein
VTDIIPEKSVRVMVFVMVELRDTL